MTNQEPEYVSQLFVSWTRAAEPHTGSQIRRRLRVPGTLSLRCRFELIGAGVDASFSAESFAVDRALWDRQNELLDLADRALKDNQPESATRHLNSLLQTHEEGMHPAPAIDAEIGLGDAARQQQSVNAALNHYGTALGRARGAGYHYAEVRAGIALGYLHLMQASAEVAADEFATASVKAADLGLRIDEANALTGLGESYQRLRQPMPAMRALLLALDLFEGIRSNEGVANATVQLGEICRRERWTEEAAGWYRQAVCAAEKSGMEVSLANALDGLAEAELALGHSEQAEQHFLRAYEISGTGYPAGQAHALNGLARWAMVGGDWKAAVKNFELALDRYLSVDDLISAASTQSGLASCAEAIGDLEGGVKWRLRSVASIETMRAAQQRHAHQGEYFDRFGSYHSRAIRAAIHARDAAAFVSVFEGIAGRRLAGLLTSVPEDPDVARDVERMVLGADAAAGLSQDTPEVVERLRQRARALGSSELRGAVSHGSEVFDDAVASLYSPFDPRKTEQLWADASSATTNLLMAVILSDSGELAWLLRSIEGPVYVGLHELTEDTLSSVHALHSSGLPLAAKPDDLSGLGTLLPDELGAVLPPDQRLLVIPAGRLWGVPWRAVRMHDGRFLGERNALMLSPSLTAAANSNGGTDRIVQGSVSYWRAPDVVHHQVVAYQDSHHWHARALGSAAQTRAALLSAEDDLMIILGHGRPVRADVHFLELDRQTHVKPADLLEGIPPKALVLICCWGAHAPDVGTGDPMTLATLALARGAQAVAATTSELLDDPASASFVNQFLYLMTFHPMPEALQLATRKWLTRPDYRAGYLSRWAPLVILGS